MCEINLVREFLSEMKELCSFPYLWIVKNEKSNDYLSMNKSEANVELVKKFREKIPKADRGVIGVKYKYYAQRYLSSSKTLRKLNKRM